jgi:Flp pilus assembly pilin Flp
MRSAIARLIGFVGEDSGQDIMEYGLLASLIATFLVGTLTTTGERLFDLWTLIAAIPGPR